MNIHIPWDTVIWLAAGICTFLIVLALAAWASHRQHEKEKEYLVTLDLRTLLPPEKQDPPPVAQHLDTDTAPIQRLTRRQLRKRQY